jgi:hypothetical protein
VLDSDTWARFVSARRCERAQELRALGRNAGFDTTEVGLAPYLYARRILGKPIDGSLLAHLRSANRSLQFTRGTLSHGRGNVRSEIERSNWETTARVLVQRRLEQHIEAWMPRQPGLTPLQHQAVAGAIAGEHLRAGNCGEYTDVAMHMHAGRLVGPQTLVAARTPTMSHAWAELRHGSEPVADDIVLDGWASGPPVLRGDSRYARNGAVLPVEYAYDAETGPRAARAYQALATELLSSGSYQPFATRQLRATLSRVRRNPLVVPPESIVRNRPVNVLSRIFLARFRRAREHVRPLHQQLMAVGVARALGDGVSDAAARVNRAWCRGLDRPWR